jgi:hypothetical protein
MVSAAVVVVATGCDCVDIDPVAGLIEEVAACCDCDCFAAGSAAEVDVEAAGTGAGAPTLAISPSPPAAAEDGKREVRGEVSGMATSSRLWELLEVDGCCWEAAAGTE